jgi:hypothetical protein
MDDVKNVFSLNHKWPAKTGPLMGEKREEKV